MCAEQRAGTAEQRAGTTPGAATPARRVGTLAFAGQPASEKVLAKLGAEHAAWVDPSTGTVIQVAAFDRPDDDPRPKVGQHFVDDEASSLYPVGLKR